MNKLWSTLIASIAIACANTSVLACPQPYDRHDDPLYDYGDAPNNKNAPNNGEAWNLKGIWQQLGEVNGKDDGVFWSVDNGSTWSNTTSALIIGQTVRFKFLFWQLNEGAHQYDQLLAVIDIDQDGKFEKGKYQKDYRTGIETLTYQQVGTDNSKAATMTPIFVDYFVDPALYEDGDTTWLRARVTCNHTEWPKVGPYGELGQGETEDYQLTFRAAPVPEPATMLLFGTGIAGLAGVIRRRRMNN